MLYSFTDDQHTILNQSVNFVAYSSKKYLRNQSKSKETRKYKKYLKNQKNKENDKKKKEIEQ